MAYSQKLDTTVQISFITNGELLELNRSQIQKLALFNEYNEDFRSAKMYEQKKNVALLLRTSERSFALFLSKNEYFELIDKCNLYFGADASKGFDSDIKTDTVNEEVPVTVFKPKNNFSNNNFSSTINRSSDNRSRNEDYYKPVNRLALNTGLFSVFVLGNFFTSNYIDTNNNATVALGLGIATAAVPLLLSKKISITGGMAKLTAGAEYYGFGIGAAVGNLFTNPRNRYFVNDRIAAGTGAGGSLVLASAAFLFAQKKEISLSQAAVMNGAAFSGILAGYGFSTAATLSKNQFSTRSQAIGAAIGNIGGYYIGYKIAKRGDYTRAAGQVYNNSSFIFSAFSLNFVGGYLFTNINTLEDARTPFLILGGMNVASMFLAEKLTKNINFSRYDGGIIAGTTFLTTGLTTIIGVVTDARNLQANPNYNQSATLKLNTFGLLAGYGIGYLIIKNKANNSEDNKQQNMPNRNFQLGIIPPPNIPGEPFRAKAFSSFNQQISLSYKF